MYRRRRRQREIAFSFDSFLDVVANVVGVIIRLILVTWVGARSYHAVMAQPTAEKPPEESHTFAAAPPVALPPIHDPLEEELAQHRQELENQQQRLLEQLRQCQILESVNAKSTTEVSAVAVAQQTAAQQADQLERSAKDQTGVAQNVQLSLAELQRRGKQLTQELLELEKLPPLTKTLRYHTPVSRPVHADELHFECRQGRITFIDIDAFLTEMKRSMNDYVDQLRSQWSVTGVTGPIGAFRLRYTVEREQNLMNGDAGMVPTAQNNFRYGMSGWVADPIVETRGETAVAALAPNSEFHRLIDNLDPEHAVVTLWVYPDSFALYRQLRDYLHEHNIEVAGRPLPPGTPIAATREGSASRGQ